MTAASRRSRVGVWTWVLLGFAGVAACGDDHGHDEDGGHDHAGSGAVCPSADKPTYDTFGRGFMESYCTRCHSAMATDRHGAPSDHNFDTLSQIRQFAGHIDEHAGAGPAAVNTAMPPGDPKPSEAERRKLGEWLACEKGGGS